MLRHRVSVSPGPLVRPQPPDDITASSCLAEPLAARAAWVPSCREPSRRPGPTRDRSPRGSWGRRDGQRHQRIAPWPESGSRRRPAATRPAGAPGPTRTSAVAVCRPRRKAAEQAQRPREIARKASVGGGGDLVYTSAALRDRGMDTVAVGRPQREQGHVTTRRGEPTATPLPCHRALLQGWENGVQTSMRRRAASNASGVTSGIDLRCLHLWTRAASDNGRPAR
jgi:hypothetical protein